MNKVLSDFVSNPVLFFGAFILILIGVIVIIASTFKQKKKVTDDTVVKRVVEEHPLTFEELNKNEDKADIEAMLRKMQSDIDARNNEIEEFESDQEENAIISYQELIQRSKKEEVKEESQVKKFVDQIKGNASKNEEMDDKKFKGSEFISPIYGRVKAPEFVEKPNTPIIKATRRNREIETLDIDFDDIEPKHIQKDFLENTINLEPLKNEIKHNDEFLQALKEFRNNL